MSTTRTAEIATAIGGIDDGAFRDGGACISHMLRVLALQANRQLTHAEPFASLVWDASTDTGDSGDGNDGVLTGFGYPAWVQILPTITGARRHGMRAIDMRGVLKVSTGLVVHLGFATSRAPIGHGSHAGDANVLTVTGTGAFAAISLDSIPIYPGESLSDVTVHLRGEATDTASNTATYGSPSSGTTADVWFDYFESTGAAWNIEGGGSATLDDGGHCVRFQDADGNDLTDPRVIVGVPTATRLQFWPPLGGSTEARWLRGQTFKIRVLPAWRLASLALYSRARTA